MEPLIRQVMLLLIGGLLVSMTTGHTYRDEIVLRQNIFKGYHKSIRPMMNQSEKLYLNMTFELLNIESMDISAQTLTVTVWCILKWVDELLVWNSSTYNGVHQMFITPDDSIEIWTPTVVVMNTIGDFKQLSLVHLPMKVESTGRVTMEAGVSLSTHCDADITFYPFDTQNCEIVVGVVVYSLNELNLTLEDANTKNYRKNGEWDIEDLTGYRQEIILDQEPESQIRLNLTLKRLRPFFVMNLVIPLILLSSMNVVVFALPVDSGERIGLAITALLSFAVFLSVIGDSLPNTSQSSPIVGIYVLVTFILSTLSVCLSVVIINFHDRQGEPVPRWLQIIIERLLCGCRRKQRVSVRNTSIRSKASRKSGTKYNYNLEDVEIENNNPGTDCDNTESGVKPKSNVGVDSIDWLTVVDVLDNVFFWSFFFICAVISLAVIGMWLIN